MITPGTLDRAAHDEMPGNSPRRLQIIQQTQGHNQPPTLQEAIPMLTQRGQASAGTRLAEPPFCRQFRLVGVAACTIQND